MPPVTGPMEAPVNDWAEATDGVSSAIVMDVTPDGLMAGGVLVRFAAAKPDATEVTGHIMTPGPHPFLQAIDLSLLGGRVWLRSMSQIYPAKLFRTTFV